MKICFNQGLADKVWLCERSFGRQVFSFINIDFNIIAQFSNIVFYIEWKQGAISIAALLNKKWRYNPIKYFRISGLALQHITITVVSGHVFLIWFQLAKHRGGEKFLLTICLFLQIFPNNLLSLKYLGNMLLNMEGRRRRCCVVEHSKKWNYSGGFSGFQLRP